MPFESVVVVTLKSRRMLNFCSSCKRVAFQVPYDPFLIKRPPKSQIFAGGQKKISLQDLRVAQVIFSKGKMTFFGKKATPKGPSLEKNPHFNLLDHQVKVLSFILGAKFCLGERN